LKNFNVSVFGVGVLTKVLETSLKAADAFDFGLLIVTGIL
jgi:hypothetical protein